MSTPVGYNTYVGARYVPIFANPIAWDNTREYEPLTIVSYNGNSYTSKTFVPTGADISNERYWALTGNYNAQVESYRQEVVNLRNFINSDGWVDENKLADNSIGTDKLINGSVTREKLSADIISTIEADQYFITPEEFGAVGDGVVDDTAAFEEALSALAGESKILKLMPKKRYYISTINIMSNTTIDLNGSTIDCSSIRLFNRAGDYREYNGEHDIVIKNGTIERINSLAIGHNKDVLVEEVHFVNTNGNHFIEICASKNVTIRNCKFTGQRATTSYGEMVQIDVCEPSSFQHFLPQTAENPTYDHTPNDTIIIDGCVFERGEYNLNCAIGGHVSNASFGGGLHKNITISNNIVYNAMQFCFTVPGVSYMTIENNIVYGVLGYFVLTRYTNDHLYINGNVVYDLGQNHSMELNNITDLAITGNTFNALFGVMAGCSNIAVSGNTLTRANSQLNDCIHLGDDCTNLLFLDVRTSVLSTTSADQTDYLIRTIVLRVPYNMFTELTVMIGYVSAGDVEYFTVSDYNLSQLASGRTLSAVSNRGNVYTIKTATADEDETGKTIYISRTDQSYYPAVRSVFGRRI